MCVENNNLDLKLEIIVHNTRLLTSFGNFTCNVLGKTVFVCASSKTSPTASQICLGVIISKRVMPRLKTSDGIP